MSRINNEDISRELETISLNFFSKKLKIKVIGGGAAATIKIKSFLEKGCRVEILSKSFSKEILNIKNENLILIKGHYNIDFINDGHIILITINDKNTLEKIISHCKALSKIYIDCTNFKQGMGVIPCQRELENISFSINTKVGAPKVSILLATKVKELLKEYDNFAFLASSIRENAKNELDRKHIISFVCSEDFKFFSDLNKEKIILQMFFGEEVTLRLLNYNLNKKVKRK